MLNFFKYTLGICLVLSVHSVSAQYPAQYQVCGADASDSACLMSTNGGCTESTISRRVACETVDPSMFGYISQTGVRRACTGQETWEPVDINSDAFKRFCSGCNTTLSEPEYIAVQNAILGLSEMFNTGLLKTLQSKRGLSYYDGETVMNELSFNGGVSNASVPAGRAFRERTWVPSPFVNGGNGLPTTSRVHNLVSTGAMSSKVPGAPDDYDGNVAIMYEKAIVSSQSYTSCANNQSSCTLSGCNAATPGIFDSNCRDVTIVTDVNSCGSPFYRFLNWNTSQYQPTSGARVPWSGPNSFSNTDWAWSSILPWNNLPVTGGDAFVCSSTIYSCNGWQSQGVETVCEGTWQETYTPDPITGDLILTGISCMPGAGQRGLYTKSYFYNDCTPEQTIIEIPPPLGQDPVKADQRLACCKDTTYPSACALGTDPSADPTNPGVPLGPPPAGCASWADVGVEVGRFCGIVTNSLADWNSPQPGIIATYDCSGRHTSTGIACTKPPVSEQTCGYGLTPGVPIGSVCDIGTGTWIQFDCNGNNYNTGVSCTGNNGGCTPNAQTFCNSSGQIVSVDSCGNQFNTQNSCTNNSGGDVTLACSGGQPVGTSWTETISQSGCTRKFDYTCVYGIGGATIHQVVTPCL